MNLFSCHRPDTEAVPPTSGTSRRGLLKGLSALLSTVGWPTNADLRAAQPQGVIAGAIRWDAWYSAVGHSLDAQKDLSPPKFHYRAPAHCKIVSNSEIRCSGTQRVMDAEILAAAAAGLKFWAFVWYDEETEANLRTGWELYQSSAIKNRINWCGIVTPTALGSVPFANKRWQLNVRRWAAYMSAGNYQKVAVDGLENRPLLFLLWQQNAIVTFFGNDLGNMREALAFLRDSVIAAGLGPPYIVVLDDVKGAPVASAIGAQAISNYISRFGPAYHGSYRELDKQTRAYWTVLESTGKPVVPIAMVGWDTRPRDETPGPFHRNVNPEQYYALATASELTEHISAAVRYIDSHPRACPSKVLLIYSWDECDEGGALIPTLGDPVGSRLAAMAPALVK